MQNIDYVLSKENLKGIPIEKYAKDFAFIFNGKKYFTNRLVADILSPNIKRLHYTDPSIDEYIINIKEAQSSESVNFNDFLKLALFDNIKLDSNHQKFFSDCFYQLGNIDEYVKILQDPSEEINSDKAINRLIAIMSIEAKSGEPINTNQKVSKDVISFIASHFESVNKNQLKTLNIDMLSEILQNESLTLNSEDSLLDFILWLYAEDPSYSSLFEYVLFKNVSQEKLELFVSQFNLYDINISIWNSICSRLVPAKQHRVENSKRYSQNSHFLSTIELPYKKGDEFNGIFNFLSTKVQGNVHDKGIVDITSDSIFQNHHPKYLVDFESSDYYESKAATKATITFDFKERLFRPSAYTIKSHAKPKGNSWHLRSWAVDVSKDGISWETVDERKDEEELNGPSIVATFNTKETSGFFRFLRFRQTGPCWYNENTVWGNLNDFIGFDMFEIYGMLKENKKNE